MPLHPDPYRAIDRQPDPQHFVTLMETRGRTPSHARLRRRFLRFCGMRPGWRVLEVGSGSGVLCRDVAAMVGPRGRVTGLEPSRRFVAAARRLAREHGLDGRVSFQVGDGAAMNFADARFDCTLAVTVLLHVQNSGAILSEMVRVTRPGGVVGVQDQDFGTVALHHPDRALTRRIFDGVAARMFADAWSGRTLVDRLVGLGLTRVRLLADIYQDTALVPFTRSLLQGRADNAVRFGLVSRRAAQKWLAESERLAAEGRFVFTLNFYGAAGIRPGPIRRSRRSA